MASLCGTNSSVRWKPPVLDEIGVVCLSSHTSGDRSDLSPECSWDAHLRAGTPDDLPSGDSTACSCSDSDEGMSDGSPRDCPFELLPVQRMPARFPLLDLTGAAAGSQVSGSGAQGAHREAECTTAEGRQGRDGGSGQAGEWLGGREQEGEAAGAAAPDLPLKSLTLGDLVFLRLLGSGAYGKVFLVEDRRSGARYALKHLSKAVAVQIPRNLIDEVRAMSAAEGCPFTARLLKTFVDASAFHLLQDAILGGELFTRVVSSADGRLDEGTARFYLACAVTTLASLHTRGILHRDVKPENLLLAADGYLTLVDFGAACKYGPGHEARTVTFCGTADYLAPEVLLQRLYEWGPAADCWALGVTLFFMVTGRLPFAVPDASRTVGTGSPRLADPRFNFPADLQLSAAGRDLVGRLLERNPRARLGGGPAGAMEIKAHPWFAGLDWAALERRAVPAPPNPGRRASLDAGTPGSEGATARTATCVAGVPSPVDR
ncbi:Serine Threonine protein kinase, partial [Klebsormidium nitens]